jgi:arabinogalactan endo-1,4-beta-galactosidase
MLKFRKVVVFLVFAVVAGLGVIINSRTMVLEKPAPELDTLPGFLSEDVGGVVVSPGSEDKPGVEDVKSRDKPSGNTLEIRGVDLSSLPQVEDNGGLFYDDAGQRQDIFQILADHGVNCVRLKLWHTPANGYNNLERVQAMAARIKSAGMGFMLDIHYSDTWADPGKQYKPAAWQDFRYDQLEAAVYSYTKEAITELREQGTEPEIVQIGNEITSGLLWNDGKLDGSGDQFTRLAGLLKAGIAGVKDAGCSARIMLHLDNGGDNALYRWWFDNVIAEGVEFDVIGLSFYGYWHGELAGLSDNLDDLAHRYNKGLIVVETAYPYTLADQDGFANIIGQEDQLVAGYPATVEGQADWLRDLGKVVASAPEGLGKGVFYWEPAWLGLPGCGWDPQDPTTGNNWENQALFDFGGHVSSSMDVFLEFPDPIEP